MFAVEKDERSLTFDRIAKHCLIEKIDVELLVMKAMSLELVKGTIDEVEELVHIDWILPRYLSQAHLTIMRDKLTTWDLTMESVIKQMENGSEELLS